MNEKLKPCPFCGNKEVYINSTVGVVCDDCGASAGSLYKQDCVQIEIWNTRSGEYIEEVQALQSINNMLERRIAELEIKHSWVSIKNRLPKGDSNGIAIVDVLTFDPTTAACTRRVPSILCKDGRFVTPDELFYENEKITHWREIDFSDVSAIQQMLICKD
jgi:transcription elongation factor Elf1